MAELFNSDLFIKGGVFSELTTLKGLLAKRMGIVFGRNGSGKSTIARAFREQQPDRQAKDPARQFRLSADDSDSLSPEVQNHLFVFNEDFIDDNIKVEGGLKSIIRIGTSAELDAPIQEAKDRIKVYKEQQVSIRAELDILDGSPGTAGSVKEADKELKDGLKKAGGYTDRLYRTEGKQNLVASVLNPVLNYDPNDTLPDSIGKTAGQLSEEIDRFLSFKSGTPVNWQAPVFSGLPDLSAVNTVLAQTVRPAKLTAEEQQIFDELKEIVSENIFFKTESLIINSSRGFCPLCHQSVSSDHKHTLEQRLVKFRDEAVRNFKARVTGMAQAVPGFDAAFPSFPTSDYDDDLAAAQTRLRDLNVFLSGIRTALEQKAENPFSEMEGFDQNTLSTLVNECQGAFSRVGEDVAVYNQLLKDKDSLKQEIDRLNVRLAYHENKYWIDAYNERTARHNRLTGKYDALKDKIEEQARIIDSLSAQIDQVDDARAQINHYLDLIFGTNKLKLAPAGKDKYKLQVKQGDTYRDIPPRAVSSGERNALALAYFFACVMEKKDKNYDYSDPTLLVIDDPVSSFDVENKAGVISLIANQCRKILNGNKASKVLVLTHDYTTLRDLCDLRRGISPADIDRYPDGKGEEWHYLCLTAKHHLKLARCKGILENLEYGSALWEIFSFATEEDPENYAGIDVIGNTIRKFAESYATHMYRCKWYELFSDERHLICLPDSCKDTIVSFAVRNVLNSESHGTIDAYSPGEIQRSARVLLTYISYADPRHLRAYLGGKNSEKEDRIQTIRGWFA